mmetsp:Transcript_5789/g.8098  ORF Transcript_5789/g.8098 Transcript_5789/m.8098 type:complete len:91 (-) Transcript_5789:119-391(-)
MKPTSLSSFVPLSDPLQKKMPRTPLEEDVLKLGTQRIEIGIDETVFQNGQLAGSLPWLFQFTPSTTITAPTLSNFHMEPLMPSIEEKDDE